jgi:hypothetical protein
MAADPRMTPHLRMRAGTRAGDHLDVDVVGREGFGMVLHAGTAPEIAEDDGRHAHAMQRSQQEPTTGTLSSPAGGASRRLLVAVGPTAGHAYPALAIVDAYRARCPGLEVRFVGAAHAMAAPLLGAGGCWSP